MRKVGRSGGRSGGRAGHEIFCDLALITSHLVKGSELSRLCGISRSRIYDVPHSVTKKGLVLEPDNGPYAPLPPMG